MITERNRKILVVAEEAWEIRNRLSTVPCGHDLSFFLSGDEAEAWLRENGEAAVLCAAPGREIRDGRESPVARMRHAWPDMALVLLGHGGSAGELVAMQNLLRPCFTVMPPWDPGLLVQGFDAGVESHHHALDLRQLTSRGISGAVAVLVHIIGRKRPALARQAGVLARLCERSGPAHGGDLRLLGTACALAPAGFCLLPDDLADRYIAGDELEPEEQERVMAAWQDSARLVRLVPRLEQVAQVIEWSEKGYDGSGWPRGEGRTGEAIPLEARILKLARELCRQDPEGRDPAGALARLSGRRAEFDPVLFAAFEAFGSGKASARPRRVFRKVGSVESLQTGDRLLEDLCSPDGRLALARGEAISDVLLERLKILSGDDTPLFPLLVARLEGGPPSSPEAQGRPGTGDRPDRIPGGATAGR